MGYRSLPAQCAAFVKLGIAHIFLGYDHIVFLFALIVIGGRLGQLVKIVTAFTAGHSLTLILAALQVVVLPSRLIEGSIALTIAYVAFDNFFAATTAHRWVLTFCFGLVHGFGFANVLREMHLPASGLVPTLLSFNAGVEIGQVVIAAVLFPGDAVAGEATVPSSGRAGGVGRDFPRRRRLVHPACVRFVVHADLGSRT